VPPRAGFDGGISLALADVIGPLLASEALLLALLWGLAAAVLPWLVRGRHLAFDVPAAAAWAAGLAAATAAVAARSEGAEPAHLAAGALLAGGAALAIRWAPRPASAGY
jgi:hypothetical protein